MRYLVTSKWGGALLVLLGFACWIGTTSATRDLDGENLAGYAVGGFAFFLVACFLPEYRNKYHWLGRRSALQLMAFFFWLAGNAVGRMEAAREWEEAVAFKGAFTLGSLAFAFGSYYAAKFLIRGFRAPAAYGKEPNEFLHKEI